MNSQQRTTPPALRALSTRRPSAQQQPVGSQSAESQPIESQSVGRNLACLGLAAGLIIGGGTGCSSGSDDGEQNPYVVQSTSLAIASGSSALAADDDWLAFLISEAGQAGTDYNQDGDTNDGIAVRFDTASSNATILNVAATDLSFARRTLFLDVLESQDETDWNGDGDMTDRVLLYQTPNAAVATFLDDLASGTEVVTIGGAVIYADSGAPTSDLETNLRITEVSANGATPSAPMMLLTGTDPNMDGISYTVTGHDQDVVFLSANEAIDGDLNADGDSTDGSIFAVLDAGALTPTAVSTGIGFGPNTTPTVAAVTGGDWLVAFLADESQEGVSLNDPNDFSPTWAAPSCTTDDTDTVDFVLHWFQLSDLAMNSGAVNTGLIGESTGTAYALAAGFVGVVSDEADQGLGNCDYNGDGDEVDMIFRWVAAMNPALAPLPPTGAAVLVAVDTDVPGGSGGVARLAGNWFVQVDETADGRNYDTDATTDRDIALALDPAAGNPAWNALHGPTAGSTIPATVTWLAENPDSTAELYASIAEETRTVATTGDLNGDGDALDAVPTIPKVQSGTRLIFPGIPIAVHPTNPGVITDKNVGYARVDESAQNMTDLNGDGDINDVLLMRFSLTNSFQPTLMGTSNTVARSAATFGPGNTEFGACLTDESLDGVDRNSDGDSADTVVRFFRLP